MVTRLKKHIPDLFTVGQKRVRRQQPKQVFQEGQDRVGIWDAHDLDPWETIRWETVRMIFCRQHKSDGKVVEAYWLTDFPASQVNSRNSSLPASETSAIRFP